MKRAGIVILIIGIAFTLFTGLSFFTRENVVDIGALQISAKKKHSISWSPIVGAVAIVLGGGLYLLGRKNSSIR
jgi:LPXTG-motif cell wall-anchored protein